MKKFIIVSQYNKRDGINLKMRNKLWMIKVYRLYD